MTEPSPPPNELRRRAERLAGTGEWAELRDLLGGVEREAVLARSALAYRLGEALYHTGRLRELREFAGSFLAAARERADGRGILRSMNLNFIAAFELGETDEAVGWGERMVELAEAERDEEMLARALHNLGLATNLRGDPDRALAQYQLARPVYERIRHTRGVAQLEHNIGISLRDLGRLEEAADAYRRAVRLARRIGYAPLEVIATAGRAEVSVREGDPTLARVLAERSVAAAEELGNPAFVAEGTRVLGKALGADPGSAPDLEEALATLERARELGERVGHRLLVAEIDRDLAETLGRAGRAEEAERRRKAALEGFERLGAEGEAAELRR